MQAVLDKMRIKGKGTTVFPKFEVIKSNINNNVENATRYLNTHDVSTKSDHILIKIISLLRVNKEDEPYRVHSKANDNATAIASVTGVATSLNYPSAIFHDFINEDIDEILLLEQSTFPHSIMGGGKFITWKELEPLKVVYHPMTVVIPELLDGDVVTEGINNYAIFTIDIAILALMFRGWLDYNEELDPMERENISMFIAKYVIPKMYPKFTDIAMVNRYQAIADMTYLPDSFTSLPMFLFDVDKKLTKHQKQVLSVVERKRLDVSQILNTIPMPSGGTLVDVLPKLDVMGTRQVDWILLLAHLPYLKLIATLIDNESGKNSEFEASFRKHYKKAKTARLTSSSNFLFFNSLMEYELEIVKIKLA